MLGTTHVRQAAGAKLANIYRLHGSMKSILAPMAVPGRELPLAAVNS
jgi:hypothetical protein